MTAYIASKTTGTNLIAPLLENEAVEVFGLLLLNTKQEPLCWHVVSRGCLDATLVHPREVVKAAVTGEGR